MRREAGQVSNQAYAGIPCSRQARQETLTCFAAIADSVVVVLDEWLSRVYWIVVGPPWREEPGTQLFDPSAVLDVVLCLAQAQTAHTGTRRSDLDESFSSSKAQGQDGKQMRLMGVRGSCDPCVSQRPATTMVGSAG